MEQNEVSAEQQQNEAFMTEYKALVDKYQRDFADYPMFVPDGQGGFKIMVQTTLVDMTKFPQKSPFVPEA